MPWPSRRPALLWAALAASLIAGTGLAAAFDGLGRSLRHMPPAALSDPSTILFDFISPAGLRAAGIGGVRYGSYNEALADPAPAREALGIDLPSLDGILQFGPPESLITVFSGRRLDPRSIASVLAERGGQRYDEAGYAVFPIVPRSSAAADRPVGWIAIGSQSAVMAPYLGPLRLAMAYGAQGEGGLPALGRMVEAARAAAGAGSDAHYAFGFRPAAFRSAANLAGGDRGLSPDETGEASPFSLVILVASRQPAGEAAQIVLRCPDRPSAEAVAAAVARRLAAWPDPRAGAAAIAASVADGDDGEAVAVVTVTFAPASPRAAVAEVTRWLEAIFAGDFPPLRP